ncbi:hypothetical protein RI129_010737 [Pyrocoelia pectoralis]|uniref:Uncharacterized protein n=1 Tax=Pyrocoelia pectoralis TaxID=417401 RepID=A0AAN7V6T3_9COLE
MFTYLSSLLAFSFPILAFGVTDFHPEEPCNRVGGQCIRLDQCSIPVPKEYLNLCPEQQDQGAECCHGRIRNEFRCEKLQGACFGAESNCRQVKQAIDCPSGQICCPLV